MFTASHNPAEYNGIKLCRADAVPDRAWSPGWPRSVTGCVPGDPCTEPRGSVTERDVLADYAAHLLVPGAGDRPAAEGRRRRRQRDGRAHRARRLRPASRPRSTWCRCTSSSTAPSRTTRPTRSSPRTCADLQARVLADGRRHRPRLRRRRRPLLPGRRARRAGRAVGAHRADRRPRAGQGARCGRDPQPDHARAVPGDRHRARRQAGPHPGRALLHQGHDGRDRRDLRRRALRPLLLPRLLAGRLRHARRAARPGRPGGDRPSRCRELLAAYDRYVASAARSTPRSPTSRRVIDEVEAAYADVRRRRRSTSSTA